MDIDQLAEIAAQLVARLRDEPADANARWLQARVPDPQDWFRLAFVLASAVPTDRTWLALTSWTRPDAPEVIAERRRQLNVALAGGRGRRPTICQADVLTVGLSTPVVDDDRTEEAA